MTSAALKAARGLIRDFGEVEQLQVSIKGPGEFVSTADLKAERTLKNELTRARPGYGLLFEESGESAGSDPHHRWIVDPLDGTTNFLHGIPHFAISIALERDAEIVAGVVYEPTRDEMFWAEQGAGAYLNDRRIRVSARRQLGEALIGTGIPVYGRGDHPRYIATLAAVMGATSAGMITLAGVSPPTTATGDCQTAGEAFQAAVAKVTNALRGYEQCVSASKGQDKCSAEMQQIDDAHDDFEDAVNDYKQA